MYALFVPELALDFELVRDPHPKAMVRLFEWGRFRHSGSIVRFDVAILVGMLLLYIQ